MSIKLINRRLSYPPPCITQLSLLLLELILQNLIHKYVTKHEEDWNSTR